jgi:hypothetical protein
MFRQIALIVLFSAGTMLAQTAPSNATSNSAVAPLLSRIWRITSTTPYPNSSSIYIFLPNGTLFEGSCVETYRIATWKADPKNPQTLEVTEDGRTVFAATILASTTQTLRLQQKMAFGNHEVHEVTLSAIDKEFVCPDMPK